MINAAEQTADRKSAGLMHTAHEFDHVTPLLQDLHNCAGCE